jgi:hypothetical protein
LASLAGTEELHGSFEVFTSPSPVKVLQMSDSFYIRVRGDIKGPFSRPHLISLIRKKRIGRHHELSVDGTHWQKVGDVEGLFEAITPKVLLPEFSAVAAEKEPAAPKSDGTKECPYCAEIIKTAARKCRHCGELLDDLRLRPPRISDTDPQRYRSAIDDLSVMPSQQDRHRQTEKNFGESGSARMITPSSPAKDPLLMALLSGCCIAGLGHIILGQTTKGIVFLLANIVLAVITAGVAVLFTWPLMGIDAYLVARKLKNGQSVSEWESFPS